MAREMAQDNTTAQAAAKGAPLIWVLKGLRAGDTAQALALAQRVAARTGGTVVEQQLTFTARHMVPNVLAGASAAALTAEARTALVPQWPDMVIATGKRTAPVALWIKAQAGGRTRTVQLGRPRMDVADFDLVITTPQYGLPPAPSVVELPLPFSNRKATDSDVLARHQSLWARLPRPWFAVVAGGAKFPLRLGQSELARFAAAADKLARHAGGSLLLIDSPRSPAGALDVMAQAVQAPHWRFRRGVDDNPYAAALALADGFCVTSDSVSMVGEMLETGRPVHLFLLPRATLAPRWRARRGAAAWLARRGMLAPPRDVDGTMRGLLDAGLVGNLADGTLPTQAMDAAAAQEAVVVRVSSLLTATAGVRPS